MDVYAPVTVPDLFTPGRYGLTSVVNWISPSDSHWGGGIQYDADCTDVNVAALECISGAPETIAHMSEATWEHETRGARAFDVYSRVDCSPADGDWWNVAQTRALRALTNSAPWQLERTFWSGHSHIAPAHIYPNLIATGPIYDETNRILLQPSATVISGSPLDVVEGLGALEASFAACYHGEGVIHAPFRMAAALAAQNLIFKDGSVLRTHNGNAVALGRGYNAARGPGDTTPPVGATWMMMTSPIFGYRGQARTFTAAESFDRSVNTLEMIAEQKFLLAWSCCLHSVLVTYGGETAGRAGLDT